MIIESSAEENICEQKGNSIFKGSESNKTISTNIETSNLDNNTSNTDNTAYKTTTEREKAYFKIQYGDYSNGDDNDDDIMFKFFVSNLKCYIGRLRRGKKCEPKIYNSKKSAHIRLFPSRHISRRHLKIFWDKLSQSWMIENLSKNKLYVGSRLLSKGELPIKLDKITPISGVAFKFYFIEAKKD